MNTESMQAELARLQAENDKLRGQVEGLKGCLVATMLIYVLPTIPKDLLQPISKKMAEGANVDDVISQFWNIFERRSIADIVAEPMTVNDISQRDQIMTTIKGSGLI